MEQSFADVPNPQDSQQSQNKSKSQVSPTEETMILAKKKENSLVSGDSNETINEGSTTPSPNITINTKSQTEDPDATINLIDPNKTIDTDFSPFVFAETRVQELPKLPKKSEDSQQKIGPYTLQELLGTGGMGKVYKAYHPQLDRIVAIKMMLNHAKLDSRERARFLSEAQLAAKLQHPNIVSIHDVGTEQGVDYIVMDYIQGISLEDYIKNQKPNPRRSLEIMVEIALAMEYAHQKGIVHRDLKPANLLMDSANHPIITDFGLAKNIATTSHLTQSGETLGTPKYMAPEQALGYQDMIAPCTDVYALGAILYEMLTGKQAVPGDSPAAVIYNVIYQDVLPPSKHNPKLARELDIICLKALAKEQNQRYASAAVFAEDIRRFLNGEIILARRPTLTYYTWRFLKKYKITCCLVTFLLCILAGVLYWSNYIQEEQQEQIRQQRERTIQKYWENIQKQKESALFQKADGFVQEFLSVRKHSKSKDPVKNTSQNLKKTIPAKQGLNVEIKSMVESQIEVAENLEKLYEITQDNKLKNDIAEIKLCIGILAWIGRDYLLSQISLEHYARLGYSTEAQKLLQEIRNQMQEEEQEIQRQIAESLKEADVLFKKANQIRQNELANVQKFSKNQPEIKEVHKEILLAYMDASALLEQVLILDSNHEEAAKKLYEIYKQIGILGLDVGNDLLGWMAFKGCEKLFAGPESQLFLIEIEQRQQNRKNKDLARIEEIMQNCIKITFQYGMAEEYANEITKMETNNTIPIMLSYLQQSKESNQKNMAIKVLGKMGYSKTIFQEKDVVEWLMIALEQADANSDFDQMEECIWALGRIKDMRAAELVQRIRIKVSQHQKNVAFLKKIELPASWLALPNPIQENKVEIFYKQGDDYYQKNNFEQAIAQYSQAIKKDAKHTPSYSRRGQAYCKIGQYAKAIADLNEAIKQNSNDVAAYFFRATSHYNLKNYDKALLDYNKASEMGFSSDAALYNNRGVIRFYQNDMLGALDDYNRALQLDPKRADTYIARALIYKRQGKKDLSLQDINQAIELHPDFARAYYERAKIYRENNLAQSLSDYGKSIELDPKMFSAYLERGDIYLMSQNIVGALNDFNQALLLNPKDAQAHYLRGTIYFQQAKYSQAIEDFSATIQINPKYADAYKYRGLIYARLQQHNKAVLDVQKYLQLIQDDPDIPQLQNYLKQYGSK